MSSQKSAAGGGKGKKGKGKTNNNRDEEETEEKLQAVILADDFDTRFGPFTEEKPRCLLPMANTALIDYTLQFLASNGVSEVYIYPGVETADEVEAHIQKSQWNPESSTSPFESVEVIISNATSIGEAMRDLDRRKVMSGDFLVVHGDLVSNIDIGDALIKHKARRAKDKNVIMTMLLGMAEAAENSMSMQSNTQVFVIERRGRVMHYEEINPLLREDRYIRLSADILSSHTDIEIRTDLTDFGIDICTPDVLALWTDEFDYQEPRKQFLHGVLKDFELNGKMIYTEILDDDYAARVNNLQAYHDVGQDILARWSFPLVPDSNMIKGSMCTYTNDHIIQEMGVVLARACRLGKQSVVGRETSIADGAKISHSTIGRRCQIGKNVTIQNAYIWDDVTIGDGAQITQSIIGSEATIGRNAKISGGTVISFGVQIADNKVVEKGIRITRGNRQHANSQETDEAIVGKGGSGYLYEDEDEPEDEREKQSLKQLNNLFYSMPKLNISSESVSTIHSDISGMPSQSSSRRFSSGSMTDDDPSGFHTDAVQGIYDTLVENGDFDSAKLEFMGLRLSNNATDKQIRHSIAIAFGKHINLLVNFEDFDPVKAVKKSLDTRGATPFLKEVAIGKAKEVFDQTEFLLELQKFLCAKKNGSEILFALCHQLYDRDVIEEEGFEVWWESKKSVDGTEGEETIGLTAVREKTATFITWLREAEEEDSDDDDEDDSDEEEDSDDE